MDWNKTHQQIENRVSNGKDLGFKSPAGLNSWVFAEYPKPERDPSPGQRTAIPLGLPEDAALQKPPTTMFGDKKRIGAA
jgi:hypothetical protein